MERLLPTILGAVILFSLVTSVNAVPPLERIEHTGPIILDDSLNLLCCSNQYEVSPYERVLVQSTLTNNQPKSQSFVFIIKIEDEHNVTVSLSWVKTTLEPKERTNLTQSWVADRVGFYTVETFVWDSLELPTPLSSVRSVEAAVVPEHTGDFSIGITPNTLTLRNGESQNVTVSISSHSGFSNPVNLTFDTSYPCLETTFDPLTVTPSSGTVAQSTMTIKANLKGECAQPDTYTDIIYMTLPVTGKSLNGLMQRTTQLLIEIT